jgi:hypothetical protein
MSDQQQKSPGISTTEAIKLAQERRGLKLTRPTIIKWIDELGLGQKIGGRYYVNKEKFLWWIKYGNQ